MLMLGHVLPHSHAGTGVVEPDGHSLRSHIHISDRHHHDHDSSIHADSGHHHHHAGDQSEADSSETVAGDTLSVPTDHDSDAVYLADTYWTVSRTVVAPQIDSATLVWASVAPPVNRDGRTADRIGDPPDRYAGLPIYLLTASLRL